MLIKGSFTTDARGSLGGITASRNRSGLYLRARVTPTNVPSPARSRARNALASQVAPWQALTGAQRQAWTDLFAANPVPNKIGEAIKLSGFNGYVRVNTLQALGTLARLVAPPPDVPSTTLTAPTALVLTASAGTLAGSVTNTDPWAVTTGGKLFVFITTGQNPGRVSPSGGFTFWNAVSGLTATPPATIALTVPPVAMVAGRVYFLRFVAKDSLGRISAEQIFRVIAA
jgi:hypothetical protein